MSVIDKYMKKHPIWLAVLVFVGLSLLSHSLWILCFDMPHIYDIVHAIPTVLIYEPIIQRMGGRVPSDFIFLPLALVLDGLFGALCGRLLSKKYVEKLTYLFMLVIAFSIYWIIMTYQWLPII